MYARTPRRVLITGAPQTGKSLLCNTLTRAKRARSRSRSRSRSPPRDKERKQERKRHFKTIGSCKLYSVSASPCYAPMMLMEASSLVMWQRYMPRDVRRHVLRSSSMCVVVRASPHTNIAVSALLYRDSTGAPAMPLPLPQEWHLIINGHETALNDAQHAQIRVLQHLHGLQSAWALDFATCAPHEINALLDYLIHH